MNDDRLLLEMRRWLQEERVVLPDAEEAGRRIASELPTTRQRRRRWWRRPFLARTPEPQGTPDTAEYQPSAVPASNGRTPTVIGRTTSMLSPAKAITAGALVFAIGGAFLMAQPFGQPGASVPGAEAPAPLPPAPFSGIVHCGGQVTMGTSESTELPLGDESMTVVSERGSTWRPSAPGMSDARLRGNYTISFDSDAYDLPGVDGSIDVGAGTWRIENAEGAWQGSYHILGGAPVVVALDGEGAYDGLTAIVESTFTEFDPDCAWEWSGLIIDGELPEYPEPPAE